VDRVGLEHCDYYLIRSARYLFLRLNEDVRGKSCEVRSSLDKLVAGSYSL
jgi:hypothetical protein